MNFSTEKLTTMSFYVASCDWLIAQRESKDEKRAEKNFDQTVKNELSPGRPTATTNFTFFTRFISAVWL